MKLTEEEQNDYLGLKRVEIMNRKTCLAAGIQNQTSAEIFECVHGRKLTAKTWRKLMGFPAN